MLEVTVTVAPPVPTGAVATDALKFDAVGDAVVTKLAVLILFEEAQLLADVTAVILTTFEEPAELNEEVVKVPVPGLPAVKLVLAVVELTVFVPLTL